MFQNRLPFVSKRLCIETSAHLKSVPDRIAHTMRYTLGSIQKWRTACKGGLCFNPASRVARLAGPKGLFTWREGAPANRATRLEGLKHSPPLHATHLTGTVSGLRELSFERPPSTTNIQLQLQLYFI